MRPAFLALVLVALSAPAAAQLSSSATVQLNNGQGGCGQVGTTSASCQSAGSFPIVGPPIPDVRNVGGAAAAFAGYGVLRAGASAIASCITTITNCYEPLVAADAAASASFSDALTLANAPLVGSLDIRLSFDGIISGGCVIPTGGTSADCSGDSAAAQFISAGVTGGTVYNPESIVALNGGQSSWTDVIDYNFTTFGAEPVGIEMGLITIAQCGTANGYTCALGADYLNTAVVDGITVYDASGDLVPDAIVTSASGTNYNAIQEASVPEPGTLALAALGLGMIGMIRRERRAHSLIDDCPLLK